MAADLHEVAHLTGGWSVAVAWRDLADPGPGLDRRVRELTVRDPDGRTSWRGLPPPLVAPADPGDAADYPGLDLDVVWRVREGPLGPFTWVQSVRSGREVVGPPAPAARRFALEVRYVDLLRLAYAAEPFEDVIGVEATAAHFSWCSCLTGLLHGDGALRPAAFRPDQLAALVEWAGSVTTAPAGTTAVPPTP